MHHIYDKGKAGFTLVELAIILVIIGLLTGGVMTGRHLLRAAQIHDVVMELENYRSLAILFEDKYLMLPGDMTGGATGVATTLWNPEGTDTSVKGGDGNGRLVYIDGASTNPDEALLFWYHLYKAKLLGAQFTNVTTSVIPGENIPIVELNKSAVYYPEYITAGTRSDNGIQTIIFADPYQYPFTSLDVYQIDNKMDDGTADRGSVQLIHDGTNSAICGSTEYIKGDDPTQRVCGLVYWLKTH